MKKFVTYLALACIVLFISACESFAATELKQEGSVLASDSPDMCVEIQKMHKSKTLRNIVIGSESYGADESFYADINNDGIAEEFKYFPVRKYVTVAEIVNGKRVGLPMPSVQTANYSGAGVIKYNGEIFLLHSAGRPLEVQQLTKKTPEEQANSPRLSHRIYNVKTLCKYYDD